MANARRNAAAEKNATVRYVELVRVSTSGQAQKRTPEIQRRDLDRLRKSRPGVLVERIEVEGGVSGAKALNDRPDLQRLFELLAGGVDEVRQGYSAELGRFHAKRFGVLLADAPGRFALAPAAGGAGTSVISAGWTRSTQAGGRRLPAS